MRFASLGSGSAGNALLVESGGSCLLVDCGFSVRETEARLARAGVAPERITAIVVTHEHDDHSSGVFAFARRHRAPAIMSHGTLAALRAVDPEADAGVQVRLVSGERPFDAGDVQLLPFTVPHDAREPLQFVFSDGARRLGVMTDTGCSTPHIEEMLSGCDALVLETNHDLDMLMSGSYPPRLKARIAGRLGHLDNATSAAILSAVSGSRLRHVVAAHLSQANNTAGLARGALAAALGCAPDWIAVATQEEGFEWRSLL